MTLNHSRTALVTGSSGFIGQHLVRCLITQGWLVKTLRRPSSKFLNSSSTGNLEVIEGDLTPADVTRAAKGASVIYHLAGITRASSEAEFLWANAEGTRAVALGAARVGARLVYVSSLAAAGPGTPEQPRHESDACQPITAYGRSKLVGEQRVHEIASLIPLEYSIVRPPGVYGAGDKDFLSAFQAAKFGIFPVLGDPNRSYTLVHVLDLVAGIIEASQNPNAVGKTYFLGHAQAVRWSAILETLAVLFNKPYRPIYLPNAALEVAAQLGEAGRVFGRVGLINKSRQQDLTAPGWVCDSSLIQNDLGVTATTTLEAGFKMTADWYKNAGWL